jgi:hypothetical protein
MAQSWMDLTLAPRMVRQVRLQGDGQLAAATRVELRRLGLLREIDYELPELLPPLVIVCSDVDGDQGVAGEALRAAADRCPILMACLAVPLIRIGPLVEPASAVGSPWPGWRNRRASTPGARRTYARSSAGAGASSGATVSEPDLKTTLCVRVGALLVAAQALSFLQGARNQCVLNTLIEVNPLSIESRAYQVLKHRH